LGDDGSKADTPGPVVSSPISATPDGVSTVAVRLYNVRYLYREWSVAYPQMKNADAVSATHHLESTTGNAKRDELLDAMKKSRPGDVFTSYTHCYYLKDNPNADPIGLKSEDTFGSNLVSVDDIVAALRATSSPTAVVLCGCGSEAFLKPIISRTAVSVAYGLRYKTLIMDCSKVADSITAALMTNRTLNQARQDGQDALDASRETAPVSVEFECAEGVNPSLSLLKNQLLPRYRSPGA
jgi:hypothetical protein